MWMQSLTEFIENSQENREIIRANAVKMLLCGYKHEAIIQILGVSSGFISKCFAPNAPQQNPVEDIWLQAKKLIREFYFFCHSFSVVKALFELAINGQFFDFPKLNEYGNFSQMI